MKILIALASVIAFGAYAVDAVAQSAPPPDAEVLESPVSTKELSDSNFMAEESATATLRVGPASSATSAAANAPAAARDSLKVRHEISINPILESRR
jgi:hypothetical protein